MRLPPVPAACSHSVAGGELVITEARPIRLLPTAATTAHRHILASMGRSARLLMVAVEIRHLLIQRAMDHLARTTVVAAPIPVASLPVAILVVLAVLQVRVWERHRPER